MVLSCFFNSSSLGLFLKVVNTSFNPLRFKDDVLIVLKSATSHLVSRLSSNYQLL